MSNQTATTISNQPPSFPFFTLPPEIRLHIYGYTLIEDSQPLCIVNAQGRRNNQSRHDATALLAVNRQVYCEGRFIFLSRNAFQIRGTSADHKWLQGLGPEGQTQLRRVTFLKGSLAYSRPNHSCINILSRCPRLCLTIKADVDQLLWLDYMDIFANIHGLSGVTVEERFFGTEPREINLVRLVVRCLRFAQCPEKCAVHKSRDAASYTATVHIDCRPYQ